MGPLAYLPVVVDAAVGVDDAGIAKNALCIDHGTGHDSNSGAKLYRWRNARLWTDRAGEYKSQPLQLACESEPTLVIPDRNMRVRYSLRTKLRKGRVVANDWHSIDEGADFARRNETNRQKLLTGAK